MYNNDDEIEKADAATECAKQIRVGIGQYPEEWQSKQQLSTDDGYEYKGWVIGDGNKPDEKDGWKYYSSEAGMMLFRREKLSTDGTFPYLKSEQEFQIIAMRSLGINYPECGATFEQCVNGVLMLAAENKSQPSTDIVANKHNPIRHIK
jgi:hypothetical protein